MSAPTRIHRRRVALGVLFLALTALSCAVLLGAAALVPAPPVVLPLVAAVCVGCPMLAAWELAGSVAALRSARAAFGAGAAGVHAHAIAELRRALDALPETPHPLGE